MLEEDAKMVLETPGLVRPDGFVLGMNDVFVWQGKLTALVFGVSVIKRVTRNAFSRYM